MVNELGESNSCFGLLLESEEEDKRVVCALFPCPLVWSSFPSLLTCVLLARVVCNRKPEKVENDEGGVGEQPQLVLLLIHSQPEEEVMKLENNLDFPSSHKPEEDRHRCE